MKSISLNCCIYFHMKDGETNKDAEDRLIDVLDKAGINLVSWWDEEVEEESDE